MADSNNAFTKLVPGFDFLQGLVKNAGAAMPNVGSWIAPTLNPEELEKRIDELRTVQFWLEQNARMLGATIQALEVQRMTLSTLKTMNVSLGDLTESLKMRVPDIAPRAPAGPAAPPSPEPLRRHERRSHRADESAGQTTGQPAEAAAAGAAIVDPMQWWGALTKQFTELATNAMKESAADAAKNLAGAMLQQGVDAAGQTLKKAATMPVDMARSAAELAQGAAETAARGAGTVAGAAAGAAESLGLGQTRRRVVPKR